MEQLSVVEDTREERVAHLHYSSFHHIPFDEEALGTSNQTLHRPLLAGGRHNTLRSRATGGAVAPPTCFPLSGLFGDENFLVWISGLLRKHEGSSEFMDENHLFEAFLSWLV